MSKETKKSGGKKAGKAASETKTAAKAKKTSATKKSVAAKPAAKKAVAKKTAAKKTAPAKSAAKAKAPVKKVAAKPRRKKTAVEIDETIVPAIVAEPIVEEAPAPEIESDEPVAVRVAEVEPEAPEVEPEEPEIHEADAEEPESEPHLDRLQKILSRAGIASRRHAEEMILAGRVMVNGEVVTHLGSKADAAHDHIRVDGKLIEAAERHRTFVLNKPRGYVTTVSDPEGRPTVMEFFAKLGQRLYPVGRLDFQSEGLLLMTNDGELANSLTRAAAGVEKIYLVKVAGQPSEEDLDKLRAGVAIARGEQGSAKVRTAPAEVRQIRSGNNPWYEVVLTEGRNRELRKMFQSIGHFVEKIRRVGYGPLALDVEPGRFRELRPEEVNALRLTAEGKLKPKRPRTGVMLPKEAGRPAEERQEFRGRRENRSEKRSGGRPFRQREDRGGARREGRAARGKFEPRSFGNRPPRGSNNSEREAKPRFDNRRPDRFASRSEGRPESRFEGKREDRFSARRREPGEQSRFEGRLEDKQRFDREPRRGSRFDRGEFRPRGPRENVRGHEGRDVSGEERPPRREFRPREEGAKRFERRGNSGGKGFGQRGPGKPGFGAKRGGSRPSGFKGGFKGRPGGPPRRGRG